MTALAWQLRSFRGRRGAVRPWLLVATTDGRDGRPQGAAPADAAPSGAGPAPDPREPDPREPRDREPGDREPGDEPSTRVPGDTAAGTPGADAVGRSDPDPGQPGEAPTLAHDIPASRRPDAAESGPPFAAPAGGQVPAGWHAAAGAEAGAPGPYPGGPPTGAYPTVPYPYAPPPGPYGYPAPGQYAFPPQGQPAHPSPEQYAFPPQGQPAHPPPEQYSGPSPWQPASPPQALYGGPPPGEYPYPPPGQYAGPPPGQFGGPPPGMPGGPPVAPVRRRMRRRTVIALVVATVLLAGAAGAGFVFYERSTRTVALLAADVPADDPFLPSMVSGGAVSPTTRFDATVNRTPSGDLDGLHFDATGSSACDRSRLESALRDDPGLAAAWAPPLGIAAPAAPGYVTGLTPVRLRADTRLTAHRNSGGEAQPYAAVVQAGTAVLVDDRGVPRVRCADGGPLAGVQPSADPIYGSGWNGFDPSSTIEIRPAGAAVVEFGLVDAAGAQPFRRPAGSVGDKDVAARAETGRLDGVYLLTGTRTRCEGLQDCPSATLNLTSRFRGCPDACTVSDPELGDAVPVTREGAVWRATGTVPEERRGVICETTTVPYSFTTTLTVRDSEVRNGVWTATRLAAEHELRVPASAACTAVVVAWSVEGPGGG